MQHPPGPRPLDPLAHGEGRAVLRFRREPAPGQPVVDVPPLLHELQLPPAHPQPGHVLYTAGKASASPAGLPRAAALRAPERTLVPASEKPTTADRGEAAPAAASEPGTLSKTRKPSTSL